jgi:hypothetical protein
MLHPRFLSAALLAILPFSGLSQAASIATGPMETSYSGSGTPSINTSTTVARDLSNLSGLTPGQSIQIEFTQTDPVAWEGYFFYPAGELQLTWTATVEINVDGNIFTYTDTWTLGPATVPEGGPSGVYGFQLGSEPVPRWFVVPWGTDLSNVTVTLRDLTSISAGYFDESSMSLSGILTTSTVPEPSAILLTAIFPAALLIRRRRK